jgi:hypothetical protein
MNARDHCSLLNQAIRKYGQGNFEVIKLCDCHINDMNNFEKMYIKEPASLVPDGYNLTTGGANGKASLETIEKMRQSRIGQKHDETKKSNISRGQLGNRRDVKQRKYPEDANLPKYICALRTNGQTDCMLLMVCIGRQQKIHNQTFPHWKG